jgi:uncharacterized protein
VNKAMTDSVDYPVIDFHAHIFPEKIAEKAVNAIGRYYDIKMSGKGTAGDLVSEGGKIHVEKYIVHSSATIPEQVVPINDFIIETCVKYPSFIGFGTLHPSFSECGKEIERIITCGIKGIKLHPDFQNFSIDDESMMPVYGAIGSRLPILIHMGDEHTDASSPSRLCTVLDRFPECTFIAAHLGGYRKWDESIKLLAGRNVFFDTSSSLAFMKPKQALEIIRAHGAGRVLFGSDYPMWNHADEFERFLKLDLTRDERMQILYTNATGLLRLE